MRLAHRLAVCGATWLVWSVAGASSPQSVQVPSLDVAHGTAVVLPGHWFAGQPGPQVAQAPAMLLLHGCGGLFDRQGRLAARYVQRAQHLNALGVHVLVTDSLSPRGEKELCTQRIGSRKVTMTERRRDVLGALQWLSTQPGVDGSRLGVLGWSHGGSSVLAATNNRHPEVRSASVKPSLAVAFYPGCDGELARGYEPVAPLLMLLGEADDWTPAVPCKQLAASVAPALPAVRWKSFEGAHHGFDGEGPVRLRKDVPNGVAPGAGVHVGGQDTARQASAEQLDLFIKDVWKLNP